MEQSVCVNGEIETIVSYFKQEIYIIVTKQNDDDPNDLHGWFKTERDHYLLKVKSYQVVCQLAITLYRGYMSLYVSTTLKALHSLVVVFCPKRQYSSHY